MGSNAALGVFRVPKSIFFAAQQLDAFLYIQDTDAVAGELGRLLGIVLQHPVDGRFSALGKAAAGIPDADLQISVRDTGSGFAEGKKAAIDQMLQSYAKQPPKLTGNSIGILNVQKRIKLLCGREYGLSYTENEDGGVTAHILLPLKEEMR